LRTLASLSPLILVAALLEWSCDGRPPASASVEAASGEVAREARPGRGELWKVVRVIDGDTLVARPEARGVRAQKVRLLRIDTPERDEAGYREATEALESLVGSGSIRLEDEVPGQRRRGNHGRLLAYVFSGDLNVNVEIVRRGWSRFWTRYGRGRFAARFEAAQEEARVAGRGLWGAGLSF